MIKKYLKSAIFIFCSIVFLINSGAAFAQSQSGRYHAYVKAGIEKAFNMEISHANDYLQKAVKLNPENPTGYAFLAIINLLAYDMSFDENEAKSHQDSLLHYVNETIKRGEKKIAENPQDSKAYMAMAVARTARLNWTIRLKKYLSLAHETSVTWKSIEKAQEYDPQNYDAYFLSGLFRYHIDHFPGMPRFFASLLITSGDKQKGLQELELASQKGDLLKLPTLLELVSVYSNFEKQPARALPIISKLKETFPNNYNFYFALANVLSDLHRFDDAFNIARDVENKIRSKETPFVSQLQPRYNLLMGRIFFTQGNYSKAEEYLQKALQDTTRFNARVRAWSYVRLGMISDARKEREKAENYYSKAKEIREGEGIAQIKARKYLKNPYTPPAKKKAAEASNISPIGNSK